MAGVSRHLIIFAIIISILFQSINSIHNKTFNAKIFQDEFLQHILRVRIPGTIGHQKVKEFIEDKLLDLGWTVLIDEFLTSTPLKKKIKFHNIIGTFNMNAPKFIVLACHYDSKYFEPKNNEFFIGATDSAIPCAMMLHIAKTLSPFLSSNKEMTLQLHFLDGEEAFKQWSTSDSLYGSRHLAETLSKATHRESTMLKSIDLFVLLDLLGYKSPRFLSYFRQSSKEFEKLVQIERNLYDKSKDQYFISPKETGFAGYNLYMEDDHIPFLEKGVRILYLIPHPFPKVWHTYADDLSNIDFSAVERITLILTEFVKFSLNLE